VRRARRHSILALLGFAGAAAVSLPIIASAGPGGISPDLRADPVEDIEGPQVYADTPSGLGNGRLLIRFEGYVTNIGSGPLEVSGDPRFAGGVQQRRWSSSEGPGTFASVPVQPISVSYETADGHNHFHLNRAMRYSLWNLERTAQVAPGQKVGFCLYDIELAPQPRPTPDPELYTGAVTQFCDQNQPGSSDLRMGTSSGWRDVYDKSLAYQWIDASNTTPGRYLVGAEADPDNTIWEGGGGAESNTPAFASQQVTVPGWTAQPVSVAQTGAPQQIGLSAQKFGTQGDSNLRYRVTSPPANGTLNVAVGQDLAVGSQLVYTPRPGYQGADSFTYVARSISSQFPLSPQNATVSLNSTAPSVAISGAPASMIAGTSVQLTAALANLPGGVTWGASAGSISPAGLYKAPATPPKGGAATVRATSTANPAVLGQVAIAIKPKPKQLASPDPFGSLTAGRKLLSPLRIRVVNRRTIVGKVVTGRKGGRVTITTTFKRKVLGRCSARVGARKGFTCKVKLKRSYPLKKVRMTAKFTAKGGGTAVRRSFVIR
jgi:hypothetical protein